MRLRIDQMIYGGAALAYPPEPEAPRKATLVPFTLPGEIVEVLPNDGQHIPAEASLVQILTPSEDRIQPSCAHFSDCGGCHYQHASNPAQVNIKTSILRETLHHAGVAALPDIQAHTNHPWQYRNRSRLRVESINGMLSVGYNRRASNTFLPIHECPISAPLIWRTCEALLHVARENSPAGRCAASAAEVEIFVSDHEQTLQMTLFVRKSRNDFSEFCVRMQQLIPELTGAGAALLPPEGKQRTQKPRPVHTWGAVGLRYRVAEEDYWISRGGFFQVNRFLLDELVAIVTAGRHGLVAWDLYAGVGLFSRVLARSFERVVAVETSGGDLINTFKGAGRRAVEATTLEFLRGAVLQRDRPELIVVDPPRAGLGDDVCALLARISPAEIVYVSCDPVTLARDLKSLTASGYQLAELHLVDLFPQTFHMETVVVLRK